MNYMEQAEHFGKDNRLNQLMEECGELVAASARYRRFLEGDKTLKEIYTEDRLRADVAEEIADVYLLMDEVRHLLGVDLDEIYQRMVFKLERTEGRI